MPFDCKHDKGEYQAEAIDINGKTLHYYRCNGCHIILSGPK